MSESSIPFATLSALPEAARLLRGSRRPVIFSGAGVSKESGIPTFRDAQTGLWEQYDPAELATPEAFERNPELVIAFYEHRRANVLACKPNPGHIAIADLERLKPDLRVITQNIDGFHRLAGNTGVIELHGDIFKDRCNRGCEGLIERRFLQADPQPAQCPTCGRRSLRPAVVWFGESLDPAVMAEADAAVEACDLMIVVGTSGLVYPSARFPLRVLAEKKALIEINPESTPLSQAATVHLQSGSAQVLPLLAGLI